MFCASEEVLVRMLKDYATCYCWVMNSTAALLGYMVRDSWHLTRPLLPVQQRCQSTATTKAQVSASEAMRIDAPSVVPSVAPSVVGAVMGAL
jgi:hypothetical protein